MVAVVADFGLATKIPDPLYVLDVSSFMLLICYLAEISSILPVRYMYKYHTFHLKLFYNAEHLFHKFFD